MYVAAVGGGMVVLEEEGESAHNRTLIPKPVALLCTWVRSIWEIKETPQNCLLAAFFFRQWPFQGDAYWW